MDEEEEVLTGYDYVTRPYMELQSHPNFSELAYQMVAEVQTMDSNQLEFFFITTRA
jgi:hypothetical protein